MAKIMVFVDGSWLYANLPRLARIYGSEEYHIDFGKLPQVLAGCVGKTLGGSELDIVRTYLFGSYPANCDPRDDAVAERRLDFFDMLKEEYHYEVEVFPINYRGRRLHPQDRDKDDGFEPREKCVDIALATMMLYSAAIPNAYDIAICVLGDSDFKPVLQSVRRLGKRVALASIKGSCAADYADPADAARVKDFDIIWLGGHLRELELRYERIQRECESPFHAGPKLVWTTFRPRAGQRFYCDECRIRFKEEKEKAQNEFAAADKAAPADTAPETIIGTTLHGSVSKKVEDRGFGFVAAAYGDYFFHFTDLAGDAEFNDVDIGAPVEFVVAKVPMAGRGGAAKKVRVIATEAADT